MPCRIALIVLALVATVLSGCASRAWKQALQEDTASAYHAFLRDHPDTSFREEAEARLELVRIRKKPSRERYQAFREKYRDGALLDELRPHVEEAFFGHARAQGHATAYREFLVDFPDGRLANRARGNAEYLEQRGFGGDIEALSSFAAKFPESDYSAEAQRSASAVAERGQSGFQRVGLLIEVDPQTPGGDRIARVFRERALAAYGAAGLELVGVSSAAQAAESGLPLLRIAHGEEQTSTQLDAGRVTEPGILARTEVTLSRSGEERPIWSDVFEYRAPLSARSEDTSILFGAGSQAKYWAEIDGQFFVPIARWNTQTTRRDPQHFEKPIVALEVVGSRAIVLFGDGDFQLFDLGDPESPLPLGEYRRKRDLSSFEGVRIDGAQVAVFGADGVEVVELGSGGPKRELAFERNHVGSVVDVEALGGVWLAATNRGLLELGDEASQVRTLVPRQILGMDRAGERVVFTDGQSLFVSTLPLLRAGKVEAELRLGRGFHPQRVRAHGQSAVVIGERDAVWVDLRSPGKLRMLSRIGGNESGRVRDAAVIGERLFLLGPRGLQVTDRSGERIVDSVDVQARERIDVSGRHLVMVGEKTLQVVDATPFVLSTAAALD